MENTKITKRMSLVAVREYLADVYTEVTLGEIPVDTILEQIDTAIVSMDKKNAKAAERAKTKKTEDPLKNTIFSLLTDEFQTGTDILAQIDDDTITINKITARLTKLINESVVVKESIKVDKRKVMGYKLA